MSNALIPTARVASPAIKAIMLPLADGAAENHRLQQSLRQRQSVRYREIVMLRAATGSQQGLPYVIIPAYWPCMQRRISSVFKPDFYSVLLIVLLCVLLVAGGASREDVAGQVVTRTAAWLVVIAAIIFGRRPVLGNLRAVAILLAMAIALPTIQLIPLPPSIWQLLPGRGFMTQAATLTGQDQPWRSMAMVPGTTINALSSLIVPLAVLLCLAGIGERTQRWLPGIVVLLALADTLVGLIQFSGSRFTQPLINYTFDVSGTFANRNHFAVFLALGCLVVPVWAFDNTRLLGKTRGWRIPVAIGLLLLFLLTILASGSRAGTVAGLLAIAIGPILVREDLRQGTRRWPRWALPAGILGLAALVGLTVIVSIALGRAASVNRLIEADIGTDMRSRGLTTTLSMLYAHLPFGTGLGSFDPLFRMNEPDALLKPSYFNRAHNDFIEIVLDGGVFGLLLLIATLGWWLYASVPVWRTRSLAPPVNARLGSAMLALLLLASSVDYPARTPMIMALVIIAAFWLTQGTQGLTSRKLDD